VSIALSVLHTQHFSQSAVDIDCAQEIFFPLFLVAVQPAVHKYIVEILITYNRRYVCTGPAELFWKKHLVKLSDLKPKQGNLCTSLELHFASLHCIKKVGDQLKKYYPPFPTFPTSTVCNYTRISMPHIYM
jgi:hypothetical protein